MANDQAGCCRPRRAVIGSGRAPRQLIWPDYPDPQRGHNRLRVLVQSAEEGRGAVAPAGEASNWIVDKDARTGRIDWQRADLCGTGHAWTHRNHRAARYACPVSLNMRHHECFYLRCLNYARQLPRLVVSPIMRQVRKPLALSFQVSDAGASYR